MCIYACNKNSWKTGHEFEPVKREHLGEKKKGRNVILLISKIKQRKKNIYHIFLYHIPDIYLYMYITYICIYVILYVCVYSYIPFYSHPGLILFKHWKSLCANMENSMQCFIHWNSQGMQRMLLIVSRKKDTYLWLQAFICK